MNILRIKNVAMHKMCFYSLVFIIVLNTYSIPAIPQTNLQNTYQHKLVKLIAK